ncbi:hypothetical protein QAD02_022887 [Eretmocerus hayati]|uniref:Uncharacterized protein n=1 Tax=Eretmocerus hayati TaxID=131215 RepID=A0ACC2PVE4_9HYME|nr:hypothetical protein QAD02_022887 [Eretmocerus hayati]
MEIIFPKFLFVILSCDFILMSCNGIVSHKIAGGRSLSSCIDGGRPKGYLKDPDLYMTTTDLIKKLGYSAEEHVVLTEDGYYLTIHRIPGKPGSTPVLAQHGILCSSFDWVFSGKNRSLALILSDNGYDVWLGNARGNTYSECHTTYTKSDYEFWNFSWHEMGVYDLPAVINYINQKTHKDLIYIGHSMGSTMSYVMAIERPDVAEKVKAIFSLAPVAHTHGKKGPMSWGAYIIQELENFGRTTRLGYVLAQDHSVKYGLQDLCTTSASRRKFCAFFIFAFFGFNSAQFNYEKLPLLLSHTPAGASMKVIIHFCQMMNSERFSRYDHGKKKNSRVYNSTNAPDYDLSKMKIPLGLFWAENDLVTSSKNVQRLYDEVPNKILKYEVDDEKFNHIDFMWAKDANKLVYSHLLAAMEPYR